MIDEDEVDLKEQPEDNRYTSKRICKRYHYWELQTRTRPGSSLPGGSWEEWNPFPDAPPTTGRHSLEGPGRSEIHSQMHHLPQDVTPWRVLGGGEIHSQMHHLSQDVTPWRVLGGGEIHSQMHHPPGSSLSGGSWDGVKSIPKCTKYHRTSLPGGEIHSQAHHIPQDVTPWRVLGGSEIHTQMHHLPQLLIMSSLIQAAMVLYTTVVNYYWWLYHAVKYDQGYHTRGLVIVTHNSINFLWEIWKQEWSVHIQFLLLYCSLYCFFSLIRAIKSTANDAHLKRLWKYMFSHHY